MSPSGGDSMEDDAWGEWKHVCLTALGEASGIRTCSKSRAAL